MLYLAIILCIIFNPVNSKLVKLPLSNFKTDLDDWSRFKREGENLALLHKSNPDSLYGSAPFAEFNKILKDLPPGTLYLRQENHNRKHPFDDSRKISNLPTSYRNRKTLPPVSFAYSGQQNNVLQSSFPKHCHRILKSSRKYVHDDNMARRLIRRDVVPDTRYVWKSFLTHHWDYYCVNFVVNDEIIKPSLMYGENPDSVVVRNGRTIPMSERRYTFSKHFPNGANEIRLSCTNKELNNYYMFNGRDSLTLEYYYEPDWHRVYQASFINLHTEGFSEPVERLHLGSTGKKESMNVSAGVLNVSISSSCESSSECFGLRVTSTPTGSEHSEFSNFFKLNPTLSQPTLEGHSAYVQSVSFSPDGTKVASGSWDNTVKLWDVTSGVELRSLEGHFDYVWSVSFSPDGTKVASGSWDKTVKLWDVTSGVELRSLEGHSDGVTSVSFSPDGTKVASGSWDTTVKLWDVTSGEELLSLGHSGVVYSVSFSPDGKKVASGSAEETVKLWDVTSGECLQTLEGHSDSVTSVSFSSDGRRVASGSRDNTVKLWEVTKSIIIIVTEPSTLTFEPHFGDSHDTSRDSIDAYYKGFMSQPDYPNTYFRWDYENTVVNIKFTPSTPFGCHLGPKKKENAIFFSYPLNYRCDQSVDLTVEDLITINSNYKNQNAENCDLNLEELLSSYPTVTETKFLDLMSAFDESGTCLFEFASHNDL